MSPEQIPLYCNHNLGNNFGGPRKRNTQTFINLECCTGDYCNDGDFPELPPPADGKILDLMLTVYTLITKYPFVSEVTHLNADSSNILKMSIAIFGPFVIISILAYVAIYFIRRNHRKRLEYSRTKQDPDSYLVNDELLRVTSAGDSTLRVNQTGAYIKCYFLS